jgi:hypothetical protein
MPTPKDYHYDEVLTVQSIDGSRKYTASKSGHSSINLIRDCSILFTEKVEKVGSSSDVQFQNICRLRKECLEEDAAAIAAIAERAANAERRVKEFEDRRMEIEEKEKLGTGQHQGLSNDGHPNHVNDKTTTERLWGTKSQAEASNKMPAPSSQRGQVGSYRRPQS